MARAAAPATRRAPKFPLALLAAAEGTDIAVPVGGAWGGGGLVAGCSGAGAGAGLGAVTCGGGGGGAGFSGAVGGDAGFSGGGGGGPGLGAVTWGGPGGAVGTNGASGDFGFCVKVTSQGQSSRVVSYIVII
jgi:hypothetical protein